MTSYRSRPYAGSNREVIWQSSPPYGLATWTFSERPTSGNGTKLLDRSTATTRLAPYIAIDSVKTPGYYVKKKVNVKWLPKKRPLQPPQPPRLARLPDIRPFKAPIFKKLSLPVLPSSFVRIRDERTRTRKAAIWMTAAMVKYRVALKNRELILDEAIAAYNARRLKKIRLRESVLRKDTAKWKKYYERLRRYNQLVQLMKTGYVAYRRVKSNVKTAKNAYQRLTTIDFGVSGYHVANTLSSTSGYNSPNINGLYVYSFDKVLFTAVPMTSVVGASLPASATSASAEANSRATQKLYQNLNKQSVHIGNILAERAKTFEMIKELCKRLLAFKRNPLAFLSYVKPGAFTKNVSNDFLAFQFGLRPLIQDIYESAEALKKAAATVDADVVTVKASAKGEDSLSLVSYETPTPYKREWEISESVSVHYSLDYKVISGASAALSQLGLQNPAEIAWEVMPWSFVIDWILPVGNYIRSLSADAGLAYQSGTKTTVTKRTYSLKRTLTMSQSATKTVVSQTGSYFSESKVRIGIPSPPTPRLPEFKSPISVYHILELLALLRQRH